MFKILTGSLRTGVVTMHYPDTPAVVTPHFRGRPVFDHRSWRDARPAARVCPTGAIAIAEDWTSRSVTVDYGLCVCCGLCESASPDGAVRMTAEFETAVRRREELVSTAVYRLERDGKQGELIELRESPAQPDAGEELRAAIAKVLGRSLAIREVDAGSCNGCEVEINALNNPVHDIERFGIHFVASPRHADMLLVTGPVTRNMELALRKTYNATPEPRLVVAVGACGISGGIFGTNYASLGGVDQVVPVDVYVPGCPPRPQALIYGILLAVGRLVHRC
jgi:Ni,Fe-hydrogenase III small subunit/formate hydrogenlyase subunit 6/NADH:ubiquinone oxidoreductase subunit I